MDVRPTTAKLTLGVDRLCIDKWNLEELSNAINSNVLLSDVITTTRETNLDQIMWKESFRNSKMVNSRLDASRTHCSSVG